MQRIYSELIDHHLDITDHPSRVISLLSSATEAMETMGLGHRILGVSEYCHRYAPEIKAPVVGKYVNCNIQRLKELEPDLILMTSGIQLQLAKRLATEGLPVYVIPLPNSIHGILENNLILGAILGKMDKAHQLVTDMEDKIQQLRDRAPRKKPRVYLELWLGRHMRAVGGLTFTNDLIKLAGGVPVFANRPEGYFTPTFHEVADLQPDTHLFFHEPEYQVDPATLIKERGWDPNKQTILSTVKRGENMIHDGPSILDSALWLHEQLHHTE